MGENVSFPRAAGLQLGRTMLLSRPQLASYKSGRRAAIDDAETRPSASALGVCTLSVSDGHLQQQELCGVAPEYIILLYRVCLLTALSSAALLQTRYRRIATVRYACHTRDNPRMSRQDDIPPNAERSYNSVLRQRHA